jgi:hypothetical protein
MDYLNAAYQYVKYAAGWVAAHPLTTIVIGGVIVIIALAL